MGIVPLIFLVFGIVTVAIVVAMLAQGWRPDIEEEKEAFDSKVLRGNNPLAVKLVLVLPFFALLALLRDVVGLSYFVSILVALCIWGPVVGAILFWSHKREKGG